MRHFARSPSASLSFADARRRALRRLLAAGVAAGAPPLAWAVPSRAVGRRSSAEQVGESLLRASGLPLSSFGAYVRPVDGQAPLVAVNPESS